MNDAIFEYLNHLTETNNDTVRKMVSQRFSITEERAQEYIWARML